MNVHFNPNQPTQHTHAPSHTPPAPRPANAPLPSSISPSTEGAKTFFETAWNFIVNTFSGLFSWIRSRFFTAKPTSSSQRAEEANPSHVSLTDRCLARGENLLDGTLNSVWIEKLNGPTCEGILVIKVDGQLRGYYRTNFQKDQLDTFKSEAQQKLNDALAQNAVQSTFSLGVAIFEKRGDTTVIKRLGLERMSDESWGETNDDDPSSPIPKETAHQLLVAHLRLNENLTVEKTISGFLKNSL